MESKMKVINLIHWIWFHPKRNKTFQDHTLEDISDEVLKFINENTILVAYDLNNNICGVCVYQVFGIQVYIRQILTDHPWVFPHFVKTLKDKFPNHLFTANRKSRSIVYNAKRFTNKVLCPQHHY